MNVISVIKVASIAYQANTMGALVVIYHSFFSILKSVEQNVLCRVTGTIHMYARTVKLLVILVLNLPHNLAYHALLTIITMKYHILAIIYNALPQLINKTSFALIAIYLV